MKTPIDFVIIWVDGSDPAWIRSKNEWKKKESDDDESLEVYTEKGERVRYRASSTLRYWFRSVEAYAPWVHKVYFVTCGQIPDWMNPDAEKLCLVNHSDFIPEKYLPVFSSHPIELNLHRIPGLSEQFVFFNDDFYLTAPVSPSDFFRRGLPCDLFEEQPAVFWKDVQYNYIRVNDLVFANEHFSRKKFLREHRDKWLNPAYPKTAARNLLFSVLNKDHFFGITVDHLPMAYRKKTLESVWKLAPERMENTCSHRFRSYTDNSQCVFKFYQLLTGNFAPYDKTRNGKLLSMGLDTDEICSIIHNRTFKMICANDTYVTDFAKTDKKITDAFESVFPKKSSFER